MEAVKKQLSGTEVINTDESGMRVCGKLHWLHTAGDIRRTHYEIHAKRGFDAMDTIGILSDFKGTMVHDPRTPYFGYGQCNHALCNAHHHRSLQYIEKQYEQAWATDMAELLCEIKKATDEVREEVDNLLPEQIVKFEQRYDTIVNKGYEENPHPPPEKNQGTLKKKGRYKQTPALNLLDRLRDFKLEVLRFMYDFSVPFDNNQAERDIRMVKVKQKVSGSFRTTEGANCFARIRSYILTVRKNTVNVFSIIRDAY